MWPVTRTTSSFWICASLPTTWLSIAALPFGLQNRLAEVEQHLRVERDLLHLRGRWRWRWRRRGWRRSRPHDRSRRRFRDLHGRSRQRRRVEPVGHLQVEDVRVTVRERVVAVEVAERSALRAGRDDAAGAAVRDDRQRVLVPVGRDVVVAVLEVRVAAGERPVPVVVPDALQVDVLLLAVVEVVDGKRRRRESRCCSARRTSRCPRC